MRQHKQSVVCRELYVFAHAPFFPFHRPTGITSSLSVSTSLLFCPFCLSGLLTLRKCADRVIHKRQSSTSSYCCDASFIIKAHYEYPRDFTMHLDRGKSSSARTFHALHDPALLPLIVPRRIEQRFSKLNMTR